MSRMLGILIRIRRLESDTAKRELAIAFAAEAEAKQAVETLSSTLLSEAVVTADLAKINYGGSFDAWLFAIQAQRDKRCEAYNKAMAESQRARGACADARGALRGIEKLNQKYNDLLVTALQRAAQSTIDEVSQGRSADMQWHAIDGCAETLTEP